MQDTGNEDQQLKTILYIYRLLYQNLPHDNHKPIDINPQIHKRYTHKKEKATQHNTKNSHQKRLEHKRKRRKKIYKTNPKQLIKWQ